MLAHAMRDLHDSPNWATGGPMPHEQRHITAPGNGEGRLRHEPKARAALVFDSGGPFTRAGTRTQR
jgi:hypothetical protein